MTQEEFRIHPYEPSALGERVHRYHGITDQVSFANFNKGPTNSHALQGRLKELTGQGVENQISAPAIGLAHQDGDE